MSKGLYDEMGFGTHRDTIVRDVITNHTGYIKWCLEKEIFELDNEAYALYKAIAESEGIEI